MVIKSIIFFGTSDFAVPSLKALYHNNYDIRLVVTQPDQAKGRGQKLSSPPVKLLAEQLGLNFIQLEIIKDEKFYAYLKSLSSDVIVVVAYGKILPQDILIIPPFKCINVHASLLPKYRGAAPIQWTIMGGDEFAGVTIMFMNERMDEGDILFQEKIRLKGTETAPELSDTLSGIGADLLVKTLKGLEKNEIVPIAQDHSAATYAPKIKKEHGLIDWNKNALFISRMVRAFQPWPSAYTSYNNKLIKIWDAETCKDDSLTYMSVATIVKITKDFIVVQCGENSFLKINKLQIEGKNILSTKDFLSGNKMIVGEKFS